MTTSIYNNNNGDNVRKKQKNSEVTNHCYFN